MEENGVQSPSVRRRPIPEVVAVTPVTTPASTSTKRPETPVKNLGSSDEPATPVTPATPRTTGKSKAQLNIRAELDKRQGGKPLLNMVVIGNAQPAVCVSVCVCVRACVPTLWCDFIYSSL